MPSDPPSPTKAHPHPHPHPLHPSPLRTQTTSTSSTPRAISGVITPAQAIAQAWMRESAEAQQQWRKADVRAKEQYLNPIKWNTGRPEKKRNGSKM